MAQKSDTIPTGEKPVTSSQAPVPAAIPLSIGEVIYTDAIGRERLVQIARPDGAKVRIECIMLMISETSLKADWLTIMADFTGAEKRRMQTSPALCRRLLDVTGPRCALVMTEWADWRRILSALESYGEYGTLYPKGKKIAILLGEVPCIDSIEKIFSTMEMMGICPICAPIGVEIHRVVSPEVITSMEILHPPPAMEPNEQSISQFLLDYTVSDKHACILCDDIYNTYHVIAMLHGHKAAEERKFGIYLQCQGFQRVTGNSHDHYLGLCFQTNDSK